MEEKGQFIRVLGDEDYQTANDRCQTCFKVGTSSGMGRLILEACGHSRCVMCMISQPEVCPVCQEGYFTDIVVSQHNGILPVDEVVHDDDTHSTVDRVIEASRDEIIVPDEDVPDNCTSLATDDSQEVIVLSKDDIILVDDAAHHAGLDIGVLLDNPNVVMDGDEITLRTDIDTTAATVPIVISTGETPRPIKALSTVVVDDDVVIEEKNLREKPPSEEFEGSNTDTHFINDFGEQLLPNEHDSEAVNRSKFVVADCVKMHDVMVVETLGEVDMDSEKSERLLHTFTRTVRAAKRQLNQAESDFDVPLDNHKVRRKHRSPGQRAIQRMTNDVPTLAVRQDAESGALAQLKRGRFRRCKVKPVNALYNLSYPDIFPELEEGLSNFVFQCIFCRFSTCSFAGYVSHYETQFRWVRCPICYFVGRKFPFLVDHFAKVHGISGRSIFPEVSVALPNSIAVAAPNIRSATGLHLNNDDASKGLDSANDINSTTVLSRLQFGDNVKLNIPGLPTNHGVALSALTANADRAVVETQYEGVAQLPMPPKLGQDLYDFGNNRDSLTGEISRDKVHGDGPPVKDGGRGGLADRNGRNGPDRRSSLDDDVSLESALKWAVDDSDRDGTRLISTHDRLLFYLQCPICRRIVNGLCLEDHLVLRHFDVFSYNCKLCRCRFTSSFQLAEHEVVHFAAEDVVKLDCSADSDCKFTCHSSDTMALHRYRFHHRECLICLETFSSETEMYAHQKCLYEVFRCPACSSFFTKVSLVSHVAACQSDISLCQDCFFVTMDAAEMQLHDETKEQQPCTANPYYKCHLCLAMFYDVSKYDVHFANHFNANNNNHDLLVLENEKCLCTKSAYERESMMSSSTAEQRLCLVTGCNFATNSVHEWRRHVSSNHPRAAETTMECRFCHYRCLRIDQLVLHLKAIHSQFRGHRCPVSGCNYASKTRQGLSMHALKHSDTLTKMCEFCGKRFKYLSGYILHKRTHTHKARFECPDCDYTAHYNNLMKKHILKHTQEKPFKCHICDYASNQQGNMKEHLARQHGIGQASVKPFKCSICGYKTTKKLYIDKHVISNHPDGKKRTKRVNHSRPFRCHSCTYKGRSLETLLRHANDKHPDVDNDEVMMKVTARVSKLKKPISQMLQDSTQMTSGVTRGYQYFTRARGANLQIGRALDSGIELQLQSPGQTILPSEPSNSTRQTLRAQDDQSLAHQPLHQPHQRPQRPGPMPLPQANGQLQQPDLQQVHSVRQMQRLGLQQLAGMQPPHVGPQPQQPELPELSACLQRHDAHLLPRNRDLPHPKQPVQLPRPVIGQNTARQCNVQLPVSIQQQANSRLSTTPGPPPEQLHRPNLQLTHSGQLQAQLRNGQCGPTPPTLSRLLLDHEVGALPASTSDYQLSMLQMPSARNGLRDDLPLTSANSVQRDPKQAVGHPGWEFALSNDQNQYTT